MHRTQYRHTQIGWLPYGIALLAGPVIVVAVEGPDPVSMLIPVVAVGLVALLFGALTVVIDDDRLRLWFGIGLIRKSFRLDLIRAFAPVRNKWYHGWGIRILPSGMLYNVSGLSAVELVLDNGRHVRVGTDEPDALCQALEAATRVPADRSVEQLPKDEGWARRTRWVAGATGVVVAVLVAGMFVLGLQPPKVAISSDAFAVSGGFYSRTIPLSEIASVELRDNLPRILRRTNGFAAGGTLRGNFRLEDWGNGQLYINRGVPPYVVVRTRQGFVIVNFKEPQRTRGLYDQLSSLTQRPR